MTRRSQFLRASLLPASLLAIVAFAATGIGAGQDTAANPGGPQIIAVKFHADWCGYCKQMGSVFEEMQAKYDQQPVLYVTFDQTRDFNRTQSQYLAHAMDLACVWKEHGGSTGFVLLIDAKTKQVVQKLTHEQNLKQMGAALQAAVSSASAASEPGS